MECFPKGLQLEISLTKTCCVLRETTQRNKYSGKAEECCCAQNCVFLLRKTYTMDLILLLLLQLLQVYNARSILISQAIQLHTYLSTLKWPAIKQWKKKLQARKRRKKGKPQFPRYVPRRNQGNILHHDVYEATGMFEDDFKNLFLKIGDQIATPRRRYIFTKTQKRN